jgi:uncharacterized protein involved in response to NO
VNVNLFAHGFRPFFVCAALSALLVIPLWAASFSFGLPLATNWPPVLWHAHEMLFGFVCAAIAGFLLTAIPNWTGRRGYAGGPLMLMSGLWLLGRLVVGSSAFWPFALVATVDMAFLAVLTAFAAWPLFREWNRNTPLPLVLLMLWICNAIFHLAMLRGDLVLAREVLLAGLNFALILVTVIGGRITPAFTVTALRNRGVERLPRSASGLTYVTVTLMIAVAAVDVVRPGEVLAGWLALLAAIAHGARLAQWQGLSTLREPIVWILHLAYAWLPFGLAMKALFLLTGNAAGTFWLHALTVGAISTMILGVMTRVSLGHTGRPLRVDPLITGAYLLVSIAALVRIFGVWVPGIYYPAVIVISDSFWVAAFSIFLRIL